jgi:hypothetical protein
MEVDERVSDAADSLAHAYFEEKGPNVNFDECVSVVSGALSETGSSINNKLGKSMISRSLEKAEQACRRYFPKKD